MYRKEYLFTQNVFLSSAPPEIWWSFPAEHGRQMSSRDQILKMASVKSVIPQKNFFEQTEFLPKNLNFYRGDF